MIRYTPLLTIVLLFLIPQATFGQQVSASPDQIYLWPGYPSCVTFTVENGAWDVVHFAVSYPGVGDAVWWTDIQLNENGQWTHCNYGEWATGQYVVVGIVYRGWYYGAWAPFDVHPAPPTPTVYSYGATCDNGDCIWATGVNFGPDSRVVVAGENWAYGQWYYGSAWQMSPVVDVSPDGQFLALQVTDPNLRALFGWGGVYFLVVNPAGLNSGWILAQSSPPIVTSATPTCSDNYCLSFSGSFPMSAYVDFRVPGSGEILPNAYTDLVVTPTQITLRLNPSVRYAYDTSGLNAWVVNPTLANWSSGTYVAPVDRSVIGYIDDVFPIGQQYYIRGWACAKTHSESIAVHVYAGGNLVFVGTANQASEPGVSAACNSSGSYHRFFLPIPFNSYGGQPIYVYGISPFGLANNALNNPGNFTMPSIDGSITGWIEGITQQDSDSYLYGWACARTHPGSIAVHVYVGGPSGGGWGTYALAATADQPSGPDIQAACNSTGSNYRFSILLTQSVRQQFGGLRIYVHGISPFGLGNLLINNSGVFTVPPSAQQIQWKKDHIYTSGGAEVITATPQ